MVTPPLRTLLCAPLGNGLSKTPPPSFPCKVQYVPRLSHPPSRTCIARSSAQRPGMLTALILTLILHPVLPSRRSAIGRRATGDAGRIDVVGVFCWLPTTVPSSALSCFFFGAGGKAARQGKGEGSGRGRGDLWAWLVIVGSAVGDRLSCCVCEARDGTCVSGGTG